MTKKINITKKEEIGIKSRNRHERSKVSCFVLFDFKKAVKIYTMEKNIPLLMMP